MESDENIDPEGDSSSNVVSDILQTESSTFTIKYDKGRLEDHVRILATLVPDEIIYKQEKNAMSNFTGVLLFVDVSGFTDLTEKYSSLGKGGPSRLTQVLNAYIGAMVQEIMSHNGDILKFSGDAFLALWKSSADVSLSDVIHAALDCALSIQRSHGTYKTEVEVTLRVKIALSAGPIALSVIGDSNYMCLGGAMLEVKSLGNHCEPGDIMITNSIKAIILPNEYIYQENLVENYAKILSIGSEWSPSTITNQFELFDTFSSTPEEKRASIVDDDSELAILSDDDDKRNFSYMLRPSLDYAAAKNLNQYLRKFIIPPVVRAIDLCEPLEFLTEMRQVVIVFINVVVRVTKDMAVLTDSCNIIYNIVCDVTVKGGGCVNKLSMFDKDLMFLVIFGLRGFKHALEAQKALYCARQTLLLIQSLPFVESAAVGVCTGHSYCGVVGHPMRKEYTVIGRTVNKAARLMVAYPDMVSCDYQTFLQSQLQSQYFTLLPTRYLKGFKNVGPIYKFLGQTKEQDVLIDELEKTNKLPLLDRNKELGCVFYHLLTKQYRSDFSILAKNVEYSDDEHNYNMIIIEGHARQGKTRLLNEIALFINDSLELVSCTLTEDDKQHRYKVLRLMFGFILDLKETDIKTRTANLKPYLAPFQDYLCSLNDIFDVSFPESLDYDIFSENEKQKIKEKLIEYLCVKAYQDKGVVTIDNIQYMDDKSWSLMNPVLNTGVVFICATIGKTDNLEDEAMEVLRRTDVKVLKLRPLHPLCQAALICQILNVTGVSLELERYIQIHSNGNPGWIESFLTMLLHSKAIEIEATNTKDAYEQGYVIPPSEMLLRPPELARPSITFADENDSNFIEKFDAEIEDWDIYKQTIRLPDSEFKENKMLSGGIQVCHISKTVSFEQMDTDDFFDVNMIQTYDSLKVHEQVLLKCSSILGNTFSRIMLEYVMQSEGYRKNAEAIQKLFEIRVFSCARGIYTNGAIQVNHYLTDPNANEEIECYCSGFPIPYNTYDMPKYANCGYIRFREPTFRQMLVNLLTDSQANLYHVRCMWFLESNTRRCLTCGVGYFTNLIGQSNDDGMKKFCLEVIPAFVHKTDSAISTNRLEFETTMKELRITDAYSICEKITNIGLTNEIHVRTFADNNLGRCECEAILLTMYKEMVQHCTEAGVHEKLMNTLLEYAELCINTKNLTVGFSLLDDATELLDKKLKFEYLEPNWQVPLTRGRILHLRGLLHYQRDSLEESEKFLIAALKCYNFSFPKNKLLISLKSLLHEFRHVIFVDYFPHRYIGSKNQDIRILGERSAAILSTLFALYKKQLEFEKAYLASVWELTEALRSDSNFAVLCNAYADILTIEIIYERSPVIDTLETMAINMCFRKNTRLEKFELEAVARLYGAIFIRKALTYNMLESLKLSYIVIQLNLPEFGGKMQWLTISLIHKILMFTDFIAQAALLTLKLSFYKQSSAEQFGPMLYYSLCLEFRQYTTYSLEDFTEVKSLCNIQINDFTETDLTNLEMKYHSSLWLWLIRRQDWESAEFLISHITQICSWPFDYDPTVMFIFLHVFEGLLLKRVHYINTRNRFSIATLTNDIHRVNRKLNKSTQKLPCLRCRYLLLKSYWLITDNKRRIAFKVLEKASILSKKHGVPYDTDWIEHTRQLWMRPRRHASMRGHWLQATDRDNFDLDWKAMQNTNVSIPFFDFDLPF